MRNISDKFCRKNENIFYVQNRAVYEIMWKDMVEPEGPQMTI
jgi:hypothetical protein